LLQNYLLQYSQDYNYKVDSVTYDHILKDQINSSRDVSIVVDNDTTTRI